MTNRVQRTILIVDAEDGDRETMKRLLEGQARDYTVLEATSGTEGLASLRTAPLDCVLLAHDLPDMGWSDFLDSLSWNGRDELPLPVAVVTAEQRHEVAAEALRRGAQDYLVKGGLAGPALVQSIENAIEKFNIRRELIASRADLEARNARLEQMRDQLQEKVVELAEATNTKDKFMAVMSHEMRTPLNAVIGYADLLEMGVDGELEPAQAEHIRRIQIVSRHLLDLINDVLDIARADADSLELDLRPVDAGAVVEEVTAMLEVQAQDKKVRLRLEPVPVDLPPVLADLARLRQILTNLIGNAIKFTDDGEIRIECRATAESRIEIDVADSGIGIDPSMLSLIFDEFFQVRGDLTREKGGSGLGLAISRRMARLMGGDVLAVSQPGTGSTFTISLPTATEGSSLRGADVDRHVARMERIADVAAPPELDLEPVSVVAYGVQAEALAELEQRVSGGVRLKWTTDPDEVPALAAREHAALVVLDIGDAESMAWRIAGAIQDIPELAQTAILLLPSIPAVDPDPEMPGLDLGWMSLVPKPFTAAQLTTAVSTAARRPGRDGGDGERAEGFEVLVVDDDPDSRRVAARFLKEAKLRVREAQDGESALIEMRRDPPDVVVLDLMMPVLDGFGVLATMRADPALAGMPVVVLTAKSLTEAERRFLSRTAVRILQKGEHRLADVASLVLRAAARTRRPRAG